MGLGSVLEIDAPVSVKSNWRFWASLPYHCEGTRNIPGHPGAAGLHGGVAPWRVD